jgi:hypothetical protein
MVRPQYLPVHGSNLILIVEGDNNMVVMGDSKAGVDIVDNGMDRYIDMDVVGEPNIVVDIGLSPNPGIAVCVGDVSIYFDLDSVFLHHF